MSIEVFDLEIGVIQADGLAAKDTNMLGMRTKSDPYVEVRLLPRGRYPGISDDDIIFVGKTQPVMKTLSPRWDLTFTVELPMDQFSDDAMFELTLWDYDRNNDDDLMGVVPIHIPVSRPPQQPTCKWYGVPASSAGGEEATGRVQCILSVKKGVRHPEPEPELLKAQPEEKPVRVAKPTPTMPKPSSRRTSSVTGRAPGAAEVKDESEGSDPAVQEENEAPIRSSKRPSRVPGSGVRPRERRGTKVGAPTTGARGPRRRHTDEVVSRSKSGSSSDGSAPLRRAATMSSANRRPATKDGEKSRRMRRSVSVTEEQPGGGPEKTKDGEKSRRMRRSVSVAEEPTGDGPEKRPSGSRVRRSGSNVSGTSEEGGDREKRPSTRVRRSSDHNKRPASSGPKKSSSREGGEKRTSPSGKPRRRTSDSIPRSSRSGSGERGVSGDRKQRKSVAGEGGSPRGSSSKSKSSGEGISKGSRSSRSSVKATKKPGSPKTVIQY